MPVPVDVVMIIFWLITEVITRPVPRSTVKLSALACPLTSASPNPQTALISIRESSPVIGSAVNITPDASASTSSCTTTAIATSAGSIRCRAR